MAFNWLGGTQKDKGYIIGVIYGDGYISHSKNKLGDMVPQSFGMKVSEEDFADAFSAACKKCLCEVICHHTREKLGIGLRKDELRDRYSCTKHSRNLAGELKNRFGPTDTFNWYIHDEDFLDKEFLGGVMSGVFDSDGWIHGLHIYMATASKKGADCVEKAFNILGMKPNRHEKTEWTGTVMYYVGINGKDSLSKFKDVVGFRLQRKAYLLDKVLVGFKDFNDLVSSLEKYPQNWPIQSVSVEMVRKVLDLRKVSVERTEIAKITGLKIKSVDTIMTVFREWGVINKFDFLESQGKDKLEKALKDNSRELGFIVGVLKRKWSPINKPKEIFFRTRLPNLVAKFSDAFKSCFSYTPTVWPNKKNPEDLNVLVPDKGLVQALEEMLGPFGEERWNVFPEWKSKYGSEFVSGLIDGLMSIANGCVLGSYDISSSVHEAVNNIFSMCSCENMRCKLYSNSDRSTVRIFKKELSSK